MIPSTFDGFTGPSSVFAFEYKYDDIISESDLPRIEREINHNIKKTEKRKRNAALGLRPDGSPLIRAPDNHEADVLVGPGANAGGGRRNAQQQVNE